MHATFDEEWYLQPTQPPAAHLLFDLGLETDTTSTAPQPLNPPLPTWPPMAPKATGKYKWDTPITPINHPLPLRLTPAPSTAQAAAVTAQPTSPMTASDLATHFLVGKHDLATVYMSPDPYHNAFEEELDLRKYDYTQH